MKINFKFQRKMCSAFSTLLIISISFITSFNLSFVHSVNAETGLDTCEEVVGEEKSWPVIKYCSSPAILENDNRFFVYVSKSDEDPEYYTIDLEVSGVDVTQIEPLSPSMISVVDDKIRVHKTGMFIVHGDTSCNKYDDFDSCGSGGCKWNEEHCVDYECFYETSDECEAVSECEWDYGNDYCYKPISECHGITDDGLCDINPDCFWQEKICTSSEELELGSDKKAYFLPDKSCVELVSMMTYFQENGRNIFVDNLEATHLLGSFAKAAIIAASSQIKDSSNYEGKTTNMMEILLRSAQDTLGEDYVKVQPIGSLTYTHTGGEVFPVSRMTGDFEFFVYYDEGVYTDGDQDSDFWKSKYLEFWKAFEKNAISDGLDVKIDIYDGIVTDVIISFSDKTLMWDNRNYEDLKYFFHPDKNIERSLGNIYGTEQALENLGYHSKARWPTRLDFAKDILSEDYESALRMVTSNYPPRYFVDPINNPYPLHKDNPYKYLTKLAKIRGDEKELQNIFQEKKEYWQKVMESEIRITGDITDETYHKILEEVSIIASDYVLEENPNLLEMIGSNIKEIQYDDGKVLYVLKDAIEIEKYITTIDEDVIPFNKLLSKYAAETKIFRDLEKIRKDFDRLFNVPGQNHPDSIAERKELQDDIEKFRQIAPNDMEKIEEIDGLLKSMDEMLLKIDEISALLGPYEDFSPNSEISNEYNRINSDIKEITSEELLNTVKTIGEVHIDLSGKGYVVSPEISSRLDEIGLDYIGIQEKTKGTLDDIGILKSMETINEASNSFMKNKVPDEIPTSLETAAGKYSGLINSAGLLAIFSIGPKLKELGDQTKNANLIFLGDSVRFTAFVGMATNFVGMISKKGLAKATFNMIALFADSMNVLGVNSMGILEMQISGFILYVILTVSLDLFWCNVVNPYSSSCGCSIDPSYKKLHLSLENNNVGPEDDVNFVIYGTQHCSGSRQGSYGFIQYYDESEGEWKMIHNELLFPPENLPEEYKCRFGLEEPMEYMPKCLGIEDYKDCIIQKCNWENGDCQHIDCIYDDPNHCSSQEECRWDYYENICYNINSECVSINIKEICISNTECTWNRGECKEPDNPFKIYPEWYGRCCEANIDLTKTELEEDVYRIRGRLCNSFEVEISEGNCCDFGCKEYEICDETKCTFEGYAECEYIGEYYDCSDDESYTTEEQTFIIGDAVREISSIEIKKGWNLISTPYRQTAFDTSECTLFPKVWHLHDIAYESINVTEMKGGIGYWVYSDNNCIIELKDTGEPIGSPMLQKGWNQVAIPLGCLNKDNIECDLIEDPKAWDTGINDWVFVNDLIPGRSYFVDCYKT